MEDNIIKVNLSGTGNYASETWVKNYASQNYSKVVANPTIEGETPTLTSLEIDGEKFLFPSNEDTLKNLIDTTKSCNYLFYNYQGTTIPDGILNFNQTKNATSANYMFYNCKNLTEFPLLDFSSLTSTQYMFSNCQKLTSLPDYDFGNVTDASNMFYYHSTSYESEKPILTEITLNLPNCKTMNYIFQYQYNLTYIDLSSCKNIQSIQNAFYNCSKLEKVIFNENCLFTTCDNMFTSCSNIEEIILPLSLEKCLSMSQIFRDCYKLTKISNFSISQYITYAQELFRNCHALIELPELDLHNYTRGIQTMFYGCTSLKQISLINTKVLASMYQTFYNCQSLTRIEGINASNVTDFSSAFYYCISLTTLSMYGMKASFDIHWSTLMERDELVNLINNLATVTSTRTLTLGSTLKSKLKDEDIAIATEKGWTIA